MIEVETGKEIDVGLATLECGSKDEVGKKGCGGWSYELLEMLLLMTLLPVNVFERFLPGLGLSGEEEAEEPNLAMSVGVRMRETELIVLGAESAVCAFFFLGSGKGGGGADASVDAVAAEWRLVDASDSGELDAVEDDDRDSTIHSVLSSLPFAAN